LTQEEKGRTVRGILSARKGRELNPHTKKAGILLAKTGWKTRRGKPRDLLASGGAGIMESRTSLQERISTTKYGKEIHPNREPRWHSQQEWRKGPLVRKTRRILFRTSNSFSVV